MLLVLYYLHPRPGLRHDEVPGDHGEEGAQVQYAASQDNAAFDGIDDGGNVFIINAANTP